ncbi:hypothetical protein R1sor_020265 [Riccia sorocarpa]|uniref:Uncharacterized protein n=1 Tax=Riccia sorocarpa TaxID=122646 RepID=A0ABD3IEX3_9MARC
MPIFLSGHELTSFQSHDQLLATGLQLRLATEALLLEHCIVHELSPMKRSLTVLPLVFVCLLFSQSATAQTYNIWRLIANNLSDLKLEIRVCTTTGCYIRAPQSINTLGPKQVAVYGADDPFFKTYLRVTELKTGRKFERDLWPGQLDANNTANILSIVPKSSSITEFWFSDKSGKNVLIGVLK